MDNTTNIVYKTNNINPEYLGSVLINGIYYDKKTAKFILLQSLDSNKNIEKSETFYEKFLNLFKSKNN